MNNISTILLVDDRSQNLDLLEAFLAPEGYRIITAVNGEDALQRLSESAIDLIISDVMMPVLDGFELTLRIRQDTVYNLVPIILVTALRDSKDKIRGIESGCDDFISRPIDRLELLARVRSLLKVQAYNSLLTDYRKNLETEVLARTEELKQAVKKTKAASLETIYRLSMAAEYRDENTGMHIKRMSLYAAAIARKLGMDDLTVESILYASPMHDLGKIAIPDAILLKPTSLNPEEWTVMKRHTIIGAKILHGSEAQFINVAETIALCHHEKWDGSGYPNGLTGADIPISARITAIADTFDTLTTRRPYKEAISGEESLTIIEESAGVYFDPVIVKAFLDIKYEILEIKRQFEEISVSKEAATLGQTAGYHSKLQVS